VPRDRDHYEILERLATGGMAEILLAREHGHAGFQRLVVLKRLLPALAASADGASALLEEGRLMARLSHPSIVRVLRITTLDGAPALVLEHVEGMTLRALIDARRPGRLDLRVALTVGRSIAEALAYIHELTDELGRPFGIVHRDINPTNVLVGIGGSVQVADFGIARAETRALQTQTGILKGTLGYMAPEQLVASGEIDWHADVYGLGAVLYELTTAAPAFDATDPGALVRLVREARFARPRELEPSLGEELERLILACLAPAPEARPSARDVATLLAKELARFGPAPTVLEIAAHVQSVSADRRSTGPAGDQRARAPRAPVTTPVAARSLRALETDPVTTASGSITATRRISTSAAVLIAIAAVVLAGAVSYAIGVALGR